MYKGLKTFSLRRMRCPLRHAARAKLDRTFNPIGMPTFKQTRRKKENVAKFDPLYNKLSPVSVCKAHFRYSKSRLFHNNKIYFSFLKLLSFFRLSHSNSQTLRSNWRHLVGTALDQIRLRLSDAGTEAQNVRLMSPLAARMVVTCSINIHLFSYFMSYICPGHMLSMRQFLQNTKKTFCM
jgi:hypothetical protein